MSPLGEGICSTIASRTSSMPIPAFAEINGASSAGRPIMSSISFFTTSGCAAGRSILLITGITSRLLSIAR